MKKKKFFLVLLIVFAILFVSPITASADSLNDNIDEQLGNLDLSEIEEYLDSLTQDEQGVFSNGFLQVVKEILNGEAQYSISDVFSVFFGGIISDFNNLVPHFVIILAISVLCGLITSSKSNYLSESIKEVVFYTCMIAVILIVAADFGSLVEKTKNTIEKLTNLSQIMLPVILTLMIASGGNASALQAGSGVFIQRDKFRFYKRAYPDHFPDRSFRSAFQSFAGVQTQQHARVFTGDCKMGDRAFHNDIHFFYVGARALFGGDRRRVFQSGKVRHHKFHTDCRRFSERRF